MVECDIKAETALDHWSQFLRCTICFCYLKDPHTLECGHTFCKGCLKRLAQVAKEDYPEIRPRKLHLPCPTCRHPFPAKTCLNGRISTSIVLKHMMELWAKESKLMMTSAVVKLRSVSAQTDDDSSELETQYNTASEEILDGFYSEKIRPLQHYIEFITKQVLENPEDFDLDSSQHHKSEVAAPAVPTVRTSLNDTLSSSSETDVTTSSSNSQAGDVGASYSNVSMSGVFSHFALSRVPFSEFSLGRFLIMLIWCTYCVIIVGLAEAFLPYVVLFTLCFFLLVLG